MILLALTLSACREPRALAPPSVETSVAFPRQEALSGESSSMTAALTGTLVEGEGCLWVEGLVGAGRVLPVWPAEFSLEAQDGEISVSDGQGTRVRLGEEVRMGGGYLSAIDPETESQIPEACRGDYFVVGEGFAPNFPESSPLFSYTILSPGYHPALALYYQPAFVSRLGEATQIQGTLVHYDNERCIRLQTGLSPGPVTLLWPQGWRIVAAGGSLSVQDASGATLARQGDALHLSGRSVRQDWQSDIYRRAVDELPFDCCCAFFLVERID